MIRHIILLLILWILPAIHAQEPTLNHVMYIRAEIGEPINEGYDADGLLKVTIPITGGTVTGKIAGTIVPGGADFQTVDTLAQVSRLHAVYDFVTGDSITVSVINDGINVFRDNDYYFCTAPRFSCDPDSQWAWLMNRIFVCRPVEFGNGYIVLRVWECRD